MKTKIPIDLPTREKLTAALTPREVHPALVRAEEAAAAAERKLESARRELVDRERSVAELPAKVSRGEIKATALTEALRERDAAALLIPHAESTLTKARERVVAEEKTAQLAVDHEYGKRADQLERAAADLAPALTELAELAAALAATRGPGVVLCIDWPCSPGCGANMRAIKYGFAK